MPSSASPRPESYSLSLHDALPISEALGTAPGSVTYNAGQVFGGTGYSEDDVLSKYYRDASAWRFLGLPNVEVLHRHGQELLRNWRDRKSTRLNSSHTVISYAVFCFAPPRELLSFPTRRSSDLRSSGDRAGERDLQCRSGLRRHGLFRGRCPFEILPRRVGVAFPGLTQCRSPPPPRPRVATELARSEEHTSELQSHSDLVCRLLLRPAPRATLFPYTTLFRSPKLWGPRRGA